MNSSFELLEEIINNINKVDKVLVDYNTSCYLCFKRIYDIPFEYKKIVNYKILKGTFRVYFHENCLNNFIQFKKQIKHL